MLQIHHSKWADFFDLIGTIVVGVIAFVPMSLLIGTCIVKFTIEDMVYDYKNKKAWEEYLND